MNRTRTIAAGLLLSLGVHAAQCHAQGEPPRGVDNLYDRGQRELAPNWRPVGKSSAAAIFLHNEIRKDDSGRIAVWMHRELSSAEYFEKENAYLSTRERMLVDCKKTRLGITDVAYYGGRFASGAVVGNNRTRDTEMIDVVPDSIEDRIVKTTCAPKVRTTAAKTRAAKPQKRASE